MTAWRASASAFVCLLVVYVLTMAPGVTFWDAGEFITAAHLFGIPHPPGTPLYVAAAHVWLLVVAPLMGTARAMNVLSAVATAIAGGLTAWLLTRNREPSSGWFGALAGVLCAGFMTSVWANATETEVYAISLLHSCLMLCAGAMAGDEIESQGTRWLLVTAYLIALTPAVHLSALVAAPAAIVLASRSTHSTWQLSRIMLLAGIMLVAAGVGRMTIPLIMTGALCIIGAGFVRPKQRRVLATGLCALAIAGIASSALLILLLRARHDPWLNQGNPSHFAALADVVARRQYDLAPLWPRRAPAWIQLATLFQYVDWQGGMGLGRGIFTSPARVGVTVLFVILGIEGWRRMRRDQKRIADSLLVLLMCGSLGVAAYLNLKSGASNGYGFVPADAHEARERDYFFVLAFWSWGLFAGYGALASAERIRRPHLALLAPAIPLLSNFGVNNRATGEEATAPHDVVVAELQSAPRNTLLFLAGDNDTYPLWFTQQVEGLRRDVTPITLPMLPADWYGEEVSRHTGLHWSEREEVPGATMLHEQRAALIARAAAASGRMIAVTTQVSAEERDLLGSRWRLEGVLYVAHGPADGTHVPPLIDSVGGASRGKPVLRPRRYRLPDDVSPTMLGSLQCARLGRLATRDSMLRDSLETECNFR